MFKKFVSIMLSMLVFVMSMGIFTNAADTNMSITLQIDNLNMTVNDIESTIDAAPVIIDGRTLLPIRAVVEEMGEVLVGTMEPDRPL